MHGCNENDPKRRKCAFPNAIFLALKTPLIKDLFQGAQNRWVHERRAERPSRAPTIVHTHRAEADEDLRVICCRRRERLKAATGSGPITESGDHWKRDLKSLAAVFPQLREAEVVR